VLKAWNYSRRLHLDQVSAQSLSPLFIEGAGTSIHPTYAGLIDYANFQITINANLAGEPNVWRQLRLHRQTIAFEFSHLTRLALENLNATSGAARISAAAVKNIDACVFDRQDEFLSCWWFSFDQTARGLCLNLWHLQFAPFVCE
jgi:hypothetical protein